MTIFTFCSSFAVLFAASIAYVSAQDGNSYGSSIKFFNGPTLATYVSHDLLTAENVADDPTFDLTRTTMIFVHGWITSPTSPDNRVLLDAFIANGTYNVLALDWSDAAADSLGNAVQKVEPLGIAVAHFIDRLNTQKGVLFQKVYFIGHSLGAHVAGCVGKYTQGWSGKTKYIGRITGLDPAFTAVDPLHWSFGKFVDIVHTDSNFLGTSQTTGHVDFWPNGGTSFQPGCTTTPITTEEFACSHARSIHYFAESVVRANRSTNFLSVNQANPNIVIQMGINCPTYAQGNYSLTTHGSSWFSVS